MAYIGDRSCIFTDRELEAAKLRLASPYYFPHDPIPRRVGQTYTRNVGRVFTERLHIDDDGPWLRRYVQWWTATPNKCKSHNTHQRASSSPRH